MTKGQQDIFTMRKTLDQICKVPDRIISVYALEQHVWADSNSVESRKKRLPELQTISEFQIDPVRPFLNDILRNIAAPYRPEKKEEHIGQGYWVQAEFGSGKSHLLCFLSAITTGNAECWKLIKQKEEAMGRGKRESIYRFYEEGLKDKAATGKKGIFIIVKTLTGVGGAPVGSYEKGRRLSEYILDAAREQIQVELGKNVSLLPAELLADRFLTEDLERYRGDLKKFLRDPKYMEADETWELEEFVSNLQDDKHPDIKRSCGEKLWKFYQEYLKVQPKLATEVEDVLKHMVETIMAEGYSGVLLVLDEVSLFMKDRDENQRTDDEKTLVVLSNRLTRTHNLPIWTVCSAQQALETKMGEKNIIADDRLKLVKLLENDMDYYDIVLGRVREITDVAAIHNYYLYYKRGFTWPNSIGEDEFTHFFPFHKPALEVMRAVTYELTTTRSAIHFMHQTLKHQIKSQGNELIRLWELFDETVRYEEDPSGVHAGLAAIKTRREQEYKAYEACKRQIDGLTKGLLKVNRDKAIKILQTLFLYYISRTRQQGITPEDIANSVLIERAPDANPEENIEHYETLASHLKKELRQIVLGYDDEKKARYRFEPVYSGINPNEEFDKAKGIVEANEQLQREAWEHLLAMDEWPIKTRQITLDLSNGVQSIFREIAPFGPNAGRIAHEQALTLFWQGREVTGNISMRDLNKVLSDNLMLPAIESDQTGNDFAIYVGTRSLDSNGIKKLVDRRKDPRIVFWTPDEATAEEKEQIIIFGAYRKLVADWQGKDTEDAQAVIQWVFNSLQTELARIIKAVDSRYERGEMNAQDNTQMNFKVAGELKSILGPVIDRVLNTAYESRLIKFDPPLQFRDEEAVKVINGIVRTGSIPRDAKPDKNISAATNFGYSLNLIKKGNEKKLDTTGNIFVDEMWKFIEDKLTDGQQSMPITTLYKNFMGINSPRSYGLTRRMVQIYLLCLVQQGKLRLNVSSKSGLSFQMIDYASIQQIEFNAKVLDAITDIQKLEKPENWDILRPFAEKILGREIPAASDEQQIAVYRSEIRKKFDLEKPEAARVAQKSASLFEALGQDNPYAKEVEQARSFYANNIGDNDINAVLYALKEVYGYQAYETSSYSHNEVDDLAVRLGNYEKIKTFLNYETDIRTANAYCTLSIPNVDELNKILMLQKNVADKLKGLQKYIDNVTKLKLELLGSTPPSKDETNTLGALLYEYTLYYLSLHDRVTNAAEKSRNAINNILSSDEFQAFKKVERITALQPIIGEALEQKLTELSNKIFTCPEPSRKSVEDQLGSNPTHVCGLSFQNAASLEKTSAELAEEADKLVNGAINRKLEVFLSAAVRTKLEQGKGESLIAKLLQCENVETLRTFILRHCIEDDSLITLINRYLKTIKVKTVRISDFKPSVSTIEKQHVEKVAGEFQKYLEGQFSTMPDDKDNLPLINIE